jgi:hypothetical protein
MTITVRLPAKLTPDRRLIIDLPDDTDLAPGDVEVTIQQESPASTRAVCTREELIATLSAAGLRSSLFDDEPEDPDAPAEYRVDIPAGEMARVLEEDREGRY